MSEGGGREKGSARGQERRARARDAPGESGVLRLLLERRSGGEEGEGEGGEGGGEEHAGRDGAASERDGEGAGGGARGGRKAEGRVEGGRERAARRGSLLKQAGLRACVRAASGLNGSKGGQSSKVKCERAGKGGGAAVRPGPVDDEGPPAHQGEGGQRCQFPGARVGLELVAESSKLHAPGSATEGRELAALARATSSKFELPSSSCPDRMGVGVTASRRVGSGDLRGVASQVELEAGRARPALLARQGSGEAQRGVLATPIGRPERTADAS